MKLAMYIESGAKRVRVACIGDDNGIATATSIAVNEQTAPAFRLMYDFLGMRLGLPPREDAIIPASDRPADTTPAGATP